jgi:prepilin-type N-terminal cleavage/methylation domain-containing protein
MDPLNTTSRTAAGFTLVEALVAMAILTVGLLGLAQTFYLGMQHMATSTANLIAREKAREAVESVHTARDTRTITWAQIRNAPDGVFLVGAQILRAAGTDGLVNTADDATTCPDQLTNPTCVETQRDPGPNGVLGDTDDVLTPLNGFQRQIEITDMPNADLRALVVTITYAVGSQQRTYTLRTYISAFS